MLTIDAIAAAEIGEGERDSAHSLISTSTELAGTQRELEVLECRMRERRVLVETHRVELDIGANAACGGPLASAQYAGSDDCARFFLPPCRS